MWWAWAWSRSSTPRAHVKAEKLMGGCENSAFSVNFMPAYSLWYDYTSQTYTHNKHIVKVKTAIIPLLIKVALHGENEYWYLSSNVIYTHVDITPHARREFPCIAMKRSGKWKAYADPMAIDHNTFLSAIWAGSRHSSGAIRARCTLYACARVRPRPSQGTFRARLIAGPCFISGPCTGIDSALSDPLGHVSINECPACCALPCPVQDSPLSSLRHRRPYIRVRQFFGNWRRFGLASYNVTE